MYKMPFAASNKEDKEFVEVEDEILELGVTVLGC